MRSWEMVLDASPQTSAKAYVLMDGDPSWLQGQAPRAHGLERNGYGKKLIKREPDRERDKQTEKQRERETKRTTNENKDKH